MTLITTLAIPPNPRYFNPMKILVIHGPNLPFLGKISSATGTRLTLDKINTLLRRQAREMQIELKIYQHYSEESIIKTVARQRQAVSGLLLAPGALARSCHVLQELLTIIQLPLAEIHLSEYPTAQEHYDQSVLRKCAAVRVLAPGFEAYREALRKLFEILQPTTSQE